jgi:processive rubber oxygenase RoxA-like protein
VKRPLRAWTAASVLLALSGCAAMFGSHREPPSPAALGFEYFHDRDFGSPFQTGVPYALAMATIERYPEQLGGDRDRFCEKFGLLSRPERPHGLPSGFALHRDGLTGMDFAMTNCSLCHGGQIGGRIVPGLGSRELRLNALARAVVDVVSRDDWNTRTLLPLARAAARSHHTPWGWREAWGTKVAIHRIKKLAGGGAGSAFSGLEDVDAGPGRNSVIEFAKAASNLPIAPPYSCSKFPAIWVYRKRATFGYDGAMVGDRALALAAVEFNKRMPPRDILRRRSTWESVFAYVNDLQPPPYPGAVDRTLADRGHDLFGAKCARCHGTYARGNDPESYQERVVPLSVVGTDGDRLHSLTPDLVAARGKGPLARYVRLQATDGYVSPPLDGIWCRGPYLHNGSVPTLADVLRPAHERPVEFYVGSGTDYDLERMGLAYGEGTAPDGRRVGRRASPRQFFFDTTLPGNSNVGHEFASRLSAEERRALLEYLKLL